jgi:hypothetical protein
MILSQQSDEAVAAVQYKQYEGTEQPIRPPLKTQSLKPSFDSFL